MYNSVWLWYYSNPNPKFLIKNNLKGERKEKIKKLVFKLCISDTYSFAKPCEVFIFY